MTVQATYVLPIKAQTTDSTAELGRYFDRLERVGMKVIVVDGSRSDVFDVHAAAWGGSVLHVPPAADVRGLNGKTRGVLTGIALAVTDKVIIADDDVRYHEAGLISVLEALDRYDVVRPQNYFAPQVWHTLLDDARILLNRTTGGDWPGTLGVRKSRMPNGYNADVLFENLELVRTIEANGGRQLVAYDLFIARRPPRTTHFWSQRVRQAYDEFARPGRLLAALCVVPLVLGATVTGKYYIPAGLAILATLAAETGRRRGGAARFFSPLSSLAAPLWLLERAVCAWIALYLRICRGGVAYAGNVLRYTATRPAKLREKAL